MPSYKVEYWELHEAETDADNIQQAERAARDFFKDKSPEGFRFHSIREVGADQTKQCQGCIDDKDNQTGPWAKDRVWAPPPFKGAN